MASGSSSEPDTTRPVYNVFINHLGLDVKHNFAASIYSALSKQELRVFLDGNDEKFGDFLPMALEAAIRNAHIHIAIFSPNYAQSPWCLAQLSFMLKTESIIIPIYYHVEPSDLRWVAQGKGIYADAFSRHEVKARYSLKTLQEWKAALERVSFISGFMIRNNDDEGRVTEQIVRTVLKNMKKELIEEGTYAVGLDETIKDFAKETSRPPESQESIKIAGIVGMGGCGKTTLAKELYRIKSPSFDGSSFVSEVRNVSKNDLSKLQMKLVEDLLGDAEGFTIDNINLKSRRVLIVLDDIDHSYQLEALMAAKDRLGQGSFIIITTRDKGILKRYDKSVIIYEMKPMNRLHAEQLFTWHAFSAFSPLPGYEDLVSKFVDHCEGLPLTLKVLGGLLHGKEMDFWVSQSQKISKLVTKEVQDRLQLSYDALDPELQNIFLDIACFYEGKDKDLALSIWEQSGCDGKRSLETLVDMSLVELENFSRIKMHIQLRDLGRKIALEQIPCRIFSAENKPVMDYPDDQFDALVQIWIRDNEKKPVALKTRGDYIMSEKSDQTKFLKWLLWYDCPESSVPSGILLENLRILHFRNVFFNKLWLHDAKLPELLEELNILGGIGEFPESIGQLKHLKKIVIDGWPNTSLKTLPEEFCELTALEHLTLRWCRTLTSLPRHLGNLRVLRHLDLAFCDKLKELPYSFEQLVNLSYLSFQGCERLLISPHFLGEIRGLEHLNFMDCRNLIVLPAEVPCQEFLRSLNLVGTSLETLPNEIGRLVNLNVLEIGSSNLTDLPISLGNMTSLRTLNVKDCQKLRCLPDSLGLREDLCIIAPQPLKDALDKRIKENL